jgi:putative membrane protein
MMWQAHEGMGWWMVFGGILMILFWAGIIALAVWVFARLAGHEDSGSPTGRKSNPLDIARERYARGEINREQFDQIRRDLI